VRRRGTFAHCCENDPRRQIAEDENIKMATLLIPEWALQIYICAARAATRTFWLALAPCFLLHVEAEPKQQRVIAGAFAHHISMLSHYTFIKRAPSSRSLTHSLCERVNLASLQLDVLYFGMAARKSLAFAIILMQHSQRTGMSRLAARLFSRFLSRIFWFFDYAFLYLIAKQLKFCTPI